jgi:hypothetical protein
MGVSRRLYIHKDIAYYNGPLATICHVVYATLGFSRVDEIISK